MAIKNKNAVTLIELILVMTIVALLASAGTYILVQLIQNITYAPRQMNVEMTAENILDTLIDGNPSAKGLRFSRQIMTATDNQVSFIDQNNQNITYRYDPSVNIIYRSINGNNELPLLSNIPKEINLSLVLNKLFSYYNASNISTADTTLIRRIDIALIVKTGNGLFKDGEGYALYNTSIAVKRYAND